MKILLTVLKTLSVIVLILASFAICAVGAYQDAIINHKIVTNLINK